MEPPAEARDHIVAPQWVRATPLPVAIPASADAYWRALPASKNVFQQSAGSVLVQTRHEGSLLVCGGCACLDYAISSCINLGFASLR